MRKITSFTGVEDVDVRESLTLSRVFGMNNIIACLLTHADILIVNSPQSHVQRIITEYFEKLKNNKDRRDHIMDVAVGLIDAGYPEAAEL